MSDDLMVRGGCVGRRDFFVAGALAVFGAAYFCARWGIDERTLFLPFMYVGWDDFETYLDAQNILDTGWVWSSPRLAAPFSEDLHDFPVVFLHNFDNLLLKLILFIVPDPFVAVNIETIMTPPLIAVSAFFSLRLMGASRFVSSLGAATYAFLPFVFLRNEFHLMLTMYMFIPPAILLCVMAFRGELGLPMLSKSSRASSPDESSVRERDTSGGAVRRKEWHRPLWALAVMILIANNGTGYWQAFSAFFLLMTGIVALLSGRPFKSAFAAFSIVTTLFFINLIPYFWMNSAAGSNPAATSRPAVDADAFGLRLTAMLLPYRLPGDTPLERKILTYHQDAKSDAATYIGLAGTVGFFLLLTRLLGRDDGDETMYILSRLALAGTLMGTVGGFGTMAMVPIASGVILRVFSRVSLYIAFISIAALCLSVDAKAARAKKGTAVYAAAAAFFALGFIHQYTPDATRDFIVPPDVARGLIPPDFDGIERRFASDRDFIGNIEASLPAGAMIYQEPYHKFPEGGFVRAMPDYRHLTGLLHSVTLRWSYGAMRGRSSDEWQAETDALPLPARVRRLREAGFAGIYVDRLAYEKEDLAKLEGQLAALSSSPPLVSRDGTLSFFYLADGR